jgi:trigger factor
MYSPQPLSEEQLGQYAVQYLQNKEEANKIFEEVKALKVLDYLKGIVTLEKKDIDAKDFSSVA